ncbi:hypothetical protein C8R45DRAFT_384989 [Mycena sanguinolenta]|nr:hypothetical protein C8R45DRAFT_384989 [Mycena sanguinolenta]
MPPPWIGTLLAELVLFRGCSRASHALCLLSPCSAVQFRCYSLPSPLATLRLRSSQTPIHSPMIISPGNQTLLSEETTSATRWQPTSVLEANDS